MTGQTPDLSRASVVLFFRGFLLLMLASIAVRWPEETLVNAVVTAGGVVSLLGVLEIVVALLTHARRATRSLIVGHALLSIAFGAVAVAASVASVRMTVAAATVWLLLHAAFALALMHATPPVGVARFAVFGWVGANLVGAMLVMTYSRPTVVPLLYYGALYAWAYGFVQISVAMWLRRHVRQLRVLG